MEKSKVLDRATKIQGTYFIGLKNGQTFIFRKGRFDDDRYWIEMVAPDSGVICWTEIDLYQIACASVDGWDGLE